MLKDASGDESLCSDWKTNTNSPTLGITLRNLGNSGTQSIRFLVDSLESTPVILTFNNPALLESLLSTTFAIFFVF